MVSTHVTPEPMPPAAAQRAWRLLLASLLVTSLGCSSTLTTIALRDAMLQIAEFGRGGDTDETQTAENDAADDEEPVELLSLEEALESAITRLAAVGRLDAAARQMLLETLESTSQQDWPVVIESFAVSLEEQAAEETAREQVAEQLAASIDAADEAEAAGPSEATGDDGGTLALAELSSDGAAEEADDEAASETALAITATAAPAVAAPANEEENEEEEDEAAETPPAETVAEATLTAQPAIDVPETTLAVEPAAPLDAEPSDVASLDEAGEADSEPAAAIAVQHTAAPSDRLAQEPDLVERVTTAIRELPVADEPAASPEETMQRLEAALAEARRQAPLRIGNPCFAWRVLGWGDVDCCEANCFVPGQSVIVYFEVDNLTTEAGPDGHATRLDTELTLVNASGQCLHRWTFEPIVEQRSAPRRDYFARYILTMPETIQPGPLRLEMTVHDLTGNKSADVALPLEVTTAPARPVEQVASEANLVR